jgi:lysophospholipase L1-like esterase
LPLRTPFLVIFAAFLVTACGASHGSSPRTTTPQSTRTTALTQPKVAPPLPASYVALGASETFGIGASPFTRGYAYLVARALHARHFRDVGIPGATLRDAYDTELVEALALRPALATAFFGYNDIGAHVPLSSFLRDLHDLVLTLRSAGARVLIIGLPDLSLVPGAALVIGKLHLNVTAWNAGMRNVARQTGAAFLNLSSFSQELASHPNYVAADGLHPSNRGHARLAQIVAAAVQLDQLWHYH